ncbi:collagenase-like protease [Candidatus Uhrbacteria bacterium CG10_big_fil_rev_8_21_14_0_10_50_16]|uniref:Collagenase-like protease n=1 Tax=Candidatus Uhrbacteria bacterium CG10_big_fil_rev_8_21_14_0_10_50_16 TaxID=1975039 RepID=A0A2H0RML6_9BACT|nr:MAG: collagenase-like protease [Candidatus Uhrbacteria bacterium CG10_big_fil_rev_8_21_14_0_10_50_16]
MATPTDISHIELLAPAGSYEALHAAINAGADAVYFGVDGFNMRANSSAHLGLADIQEISTLCHQYNVKCYLALNTLVYDQNLEEMKQVIDAVKLAQVDAVIAFDLSTIAYAKSQGVEVHISTQHSISNIDAVKFFATWADRVVLARELTLKQIKSIVDVIKTQDIRGPKGRLVEVEIFVHGAMCVAVSGRCGMSLYMYNTSANCGSCSQPCRRAYTVTDKATGKQLDVDNEFVMSTEDLCTIGMLDEIVASGAVSLKVEGRGKPPEYVDVVIRCYKEALAAIGDGSCTKEKISQWNTRLGTVFNRGLSDGFYRGLAYKYWSQGSDSKATTKKVFVGTVLNYFPKLGVAEIRVQAEGFTAGEPCVFVGKTTGFVRQTPEEIWCNDTHVTTVNKGEDMTMQVTARVRRGDTFYKIMSAG